MNDFLETLAADILSSLIAGGLLAVIVYILVDKRLQIQQEKRAYRSIFRVTLRAVSILDYLIDWIDTLPNEPSYENRNDYYLPSSFKDDPAPIWERWRRQIESSSDVPVEFLLTVEDVLSSAELIISRIYMLAEKGGGSEGMYRTAQMMPRFFLVARAEAVSARDKVLPVFGEAQRKGFPYSSEDWLRKRYVEELKQRDAEARKSYADIVQEDEQAQFSSQSSYSSDGVTAGNLRPGRDIVRR